MKKLFILVSMLFVSGCGTEPAADIDPNIVIDSTFSSISRNIINVSCINCHGGAGGYSFNSYQGVLNAVSPGDPESSRLYLAVSSGLMPKNGTKLSAQQIQAIKDWISGGAQNN